MGGAAVGTREIRDKVMGQLVVRVDRYLANSTAVTAFDLSGCALDKNLSAFGKTPLKKRCNPKGYLFRIDKGELPKNQGDRCDRTRALGARLP